LVGSRTSADKAIYMTFFDKENELSCHPNCCTVRIIYFDIEADIVSQLVMNKAMLDEIMNVLFISISAVSLNGRRTSSA
jgi:hypothetical protein